MRTKKQVTLTFIDTNEKHVFNNRSEAAKFLGVSKARLYRLVKESDGIGNVRGKRISILEERLHNPTKGEKIQALLQDLLNEQLIREVPTFDNVWITEDGTVLITIKHGPDDKEIWSLRKVKSNKYHGYLRAGLWARHGKYQTNYIHRLVGYAWVDNPNNYNEINHIDGVKTNNHANNLEWVTHKQNMDHASIELNKTGWKGNSNNPKPIMDQHGTLYTSFGNAAKTLDIDYNAICQYMVGNRKTAQGYTFTRVEREVNSD